MVCNNDPLTVQQFEHNALSSEFPRGGSWAAATSKMERFVIIVNGWKPLTIIPKRSILDAAAALDPPLFPAAMSSLSLLEAPSLFREYLIFF